jgi:NTE family protein
MSEKLDRSMTESIAGVRSAESYGDHTFNVGLKAGGKLGNDALPRYDLFQWGGFLQQSGYPADALVTERLTFGRLMYYNKFIRQKLLEGVYAGFSLEAGKYGAPLVPGSPTACSSRLACSSARIRLSGRCISATAIPPPAFLERP